MKLNKEKIIKIIANNELKAQDNALFYYDSSILQHRLNLLKKHYPDNTKHAIAIKTCNHVDVLRYIIEQGFSLEAASIEEVEMALAIGATPDCIVFDSPVKTKEEIELCHHKYQGITLNANSIKELERIPHNFKGTLGLRINPMVKNDAQSIFNVAVPNSKFGVPISKRKLIIEACLNYPQVSCLHFHVSSGLKDYRPKLVAAQKIITLAHQINEARAKNNLNTRINCIDIGGGIEYEEEGNYAMLAEFCLELSKLANIENFHLITEYGKFVHKHAAFVVSKIEYVLEQDAESPLLAYIHLGADLFVRKVYSNLDINYPYLTHRKKEGEEEFNYTIAGPLCFAGDIIYHNIKLKKIEEGDYFIMKDVGANTWSMWSSHCNRKKPRFVFV